MKNIEDANIRKLKLLQQYQLSILRIMLQCIIQTETQTTQLVEGNAEKAKHTFPKEKKAA